MKDQALWALRRGLAEQIELTQFDPSVGAALLRHFGIRGEPVELEEASRRYGGHALALVLLGTLLRDAYGGQVSVLSQLTRLDELHLLEGQESIAAHAHRVMRSYELWFEREGDQASLALLRLVGLFDRPAELGDVLSAVAWAEQSVSLAALEHALAARTEP